jgi:sugar phosphate permease
VTGYIMVLLSIVVAVVVKWMQKKSPRKLGLQDAEIEREQLTRAG